MQGDYLTQKTNMGDRDDIEDKSGNEKKTCLIRLREEYQQQTSWVWRPEYTVQAWWRRFLYMGAFMLMFGLCLLCLAGGANEIELDYTDWKCKDTDTNASDHLRSTGKFKKPFLFNLKESQINLFRSFLHGLFCFVNL